MSTEAHISPQAKPPLPGRRLIESARRLLLVAGFMCAVIAVFWVDHSPFADVSMAEVDEPSPAVTVSGPAWTKLFEDVRTALGGRALTDRLRAHMSVNQLKDERRGFPPSHMYYHLDEAPFSQIKDKIPPGAAYELVLKSGLSRLTLWVSPGPTTSMGSGGPFSGLFVPRDLMYPYFRWSPLAIIAGIAFYAFLPWPKIGERTVAVRRWRIVVMDLTFFLLIFALFFTLPFLITGGSTEALIDGWYFSVFFFGLAGLGLLGMAAAKRHAAMIIEVGPDSLLYHAPKGRDRVVELPYSDIAVVRPVVLKPPKWLIAMNFAAAPLGGSAARTAGQMGRATLLSISESGGLAIEARSGEKLWLWYTTAKANDGLAGFETLRAALEEHSVEISPEVLEVRAVIAPM